MIKSHKVRVALAAVSVVGLMTGCAEFRDDWGDETTQATVVGGAMGAGLGAIIGSQTGSAGAGLVLGSIAGAGAGAAIGTTLQERSNTLRAQEELIERQQERLSANRRSIDQLAAARDSSFPTTRSQRTGSAIDDSYASQEPRGRFRSPFHSPAKESSATMRDSEARAARYSAPVSASADSVKRAQRSAEMRKSPADRASDGAQTRSVTAHESGHADSHIVAASNQAGRGDGDLHERELVVEGSDTSDLSSAPATLEPSNAVPPAVVAVPDTLGAMVEKDSADAKPTFNQPATGAIVTGLQTAPRLDDDCVVADGELNLAEKATAPADKLFHQRKALRLCPNSARHHVAIASTYQSLNRKSDAEFEVREALKLEPQNAAALQLLKEIS